MKNIQMIDGAENSSYSIYQVSEETFNLVFPLPGQDIEFVEDISSRLGKKRAGLLIQAINKGFIKKTDANGIHGTLFFELAKRKRAFYPNKRETDLFDKEVQRSIKCDRHKKIYYRDESAE